MKHGKSRQIATCTGVVMGIRRNDGLNAFSIGEVIELTKTVVHKGHVGLSKKGWKNVCGCFSKKKAAMNEFIKAWNFVAQRDKMAFQNLFRVCYYT